MDNKQLYQLVLGLEPPWYVSRVEVRKDDEEIWIDLDVPPTATFCCPECGEESPRYDRSAQRCWRHLDTCQYRTILRASIPRMECPEHGVRQVRVPWAEDRGRFTVLFEAMAISMLGEATVLGTARMMGLTWNEAAGIQKRAVERGLARRKTEVVRAVGIDEKSFQKRHEYVTITTDLDRGRVLWVGDHRRKESLDAFYSDAMAKHLEEIEDVVMDMWKPFISATREHVPNADDKIVFDKFHVIGHLTEAVDKVRRTEHAALRYVGDDRLKGTKYTWLKGSKKRTRKDNQTIRVLTSSGLKVGRAWVLKEAALRLWEYRSITWAKKYFKRWYFWATHSRLEPIIKVAKMMRLHLDGILGYLRNGRTNALTEGLNSKIQEIKYHARGYRNRENFRMAILFHCGGLDMDPR